MATRQSVENLIEKANTYLSTAQEQLEITNRNGFEVDEAYSQSQQSLAEVEQEIQKMMDSANHQQRDQLHRLHLKVSNYMNDMVLDQIDLNKFE
ncbi:DUF2524 family protein [Aquibacillus halophilus]|uniref:DUF2524 family protein n=1 Tax=Aquibacillus halophilus TaxID=930132 RepID=A0A6A8DM04_9BACI|nr:DUF2524 family protein [Aquibacillus halophilus]MRH44799.1 DUF2524 family protein [Aquibacillus halophilus]